MNTFFKRTISAIIFGAIVLTAIFWNVYSYFALFLFITFGCLWEFYSLIKQPKKLFFVLKGCLIFILSILIVLNILPVICFVLVLPFLLIFFINQLYSDSEKPFQQIGMNILGLIYLAIPFSLLNFVVISNGNYSWQKILGLLLLIWTSDTMAYIIGSLIGENKLFEKISPKKTWEGTIGGIIFCVGLGWFLSNYFLEWTMTDWIVIAFIIGVFGNFGDLIESQLKRSVGVKDSGTIMPGHGGFLDRFDAFVFTLPFVFVYLRISHCIALSIY